MKTGCSCLITRSRSGSAAIFRWIRTSINGPKNTVFFSPDGKTLVTKDKSPLTLALSGKATDDVEVLVRNEKKPEGVHVSVSGRPLRGKAGALKGGVLVCRDITMIKRTEVALERTIAQQQDQARLMETIFSSISDGVLVANAEGKFTFFNPSAEQIVGVGMLDLKPQQWEGEYWGLLFRQKKPHADSTASPSARRTG